MLILRSTDYLFTYVFIFSIFVLNIYYVLGIFIVWKYRDKHKTCDGNGKLMRKKGRFCTCIVGHMCIYLGGGYARKIQVGNC